MKLNEINSNLHKVVEEMNEMAEHRENEKKFVLIPKDVCHFN